MLYVVPDCVTVVPTGSVPSGEIFVTTWPWLGEGKGMASKQASSSTPATLSCGRPIWIIPPRGDDISTSRISLEAARCLGDRPGQGPGASTWPLPCGPPDAISQGYSALSP